MHTARENTEDSAHTDVCEDGKAVQATNESPAISTTPPVFACNEDAVRAVGGHDRSSLPVLGELSRGEHSQVAVVKYDRNDFGKNEYLGHRVYAAGSILEVCSLLIQSWYVSCTFPQFCAICCRTI